ncbi:MAG: nucleotidyltransferase domain-containing protein [Rhodospirillales bacterium]
MADRQIQKRLSAILAADVAGYTALMEADTDATVAAWQAARHPENVSKLILYGSYARGRRKRGSEGQIAESDALSP